MRSCTKQIPSPWCIFDFFHEIYQIYHVFLREFFQSPIQSQNTNKNSNFFIKHFFLQNLTLFVCLGKVCLPEAGPCSRRTSKAGALPYQDKTYWFSWQSNERVLRLEEKTLNYFFFLTIKTLLQELSLNFESLYLCNPIF